MATWGVVFLVDLLVTLLVCSTCEKVDYFAKYGIKRVLEADQTPSYETLANYLFEQIDSSNLADNTKVARDTLVIGEKLGSLVRAFAFLKGSRVSPERLCSRGHLADLRFVIEAMQREGASREPPVPVRRLNRVLVELLEDVASVCVPYLEAKWPVKQEERVPKFSSPSVMLALERLGSLISIPYLDPVNQSALDEANLGSALSAVLKSGTTGTGQSGDRTPESFVYDQAEMGQLVGEQLERLVLEPCRELCGLPESNSLLRPYGDLLISVRTVRPEGRSTEDQGRSIGKLAKKDRWHAKRDMERLAHEHEICSNLMRNNSSHLAKLVLIARNSPSDDPRL